MINGKIHSCNPSGTFNSDLLLDMIETQKVSLKVNQPHEFSTSLTKLMCFADEIFCCSHDVHANITPVSSEFTPLSSESKD